MTITILHDCRSLLQPPPRLRHGRCKSSRHAAAARPSLAGSLGAVHAAGEAVSVRLEKPSLCGWKSRLCAGEGGPNGGCGNEGA